MAYVVAALYRTKPGEEDKVAEILKQMSEPSRKEPGCLQYQAHRSPEDPQVFFLYEQYEDEEGYNAHQATVHFQRYIAGDAVARLEKRERTFYETIE